MVLTIKILLAVFACIVAVLRVLDLKTVKDDQSAGRLGWWRRITAVGIVKIACALATLALLALNEYWSYESAIDAKKKADNDTATIQRQLKQAHEDISGWTLVRLVASRARMGIW